MMLWLLTKAIISVCLCVFAHKQMLMSVKGTTTTASPASSALTLLVPSPASVPMVTAKLALNVLVSSLAYQQPDLVTRHVAVGV